MIEKELVVALDANNEKLTGNLNEAHEFNKLPKETLGLILQRLSLFDVLSFSISSKFISEKLDTRYSNYLENSLWKSLFEKYFPNASHNPKSYRKSLAYEYNSIIKKVHNVTCGLSESCATNSSFGVISELYDAPAIAKSCKMSFTILLACEYNRLVTTCIGISASSAR
jgi:F-box domain